MQNDQCETCHIIHRGADETCGAALQRDNEVLRAALVHISLDIEEIWNGDPGAPVDAWREMSARVQSALVENIVPPPELFYVLSLKHSTKGDHLTWWGPNCRGYVNPLEWAGKYTMEVVRRENLDTCDHSVAVPVGRADRLSKRLVNVDYLGELLGSRAERCRESLLAYRAGTR